MASTVEHLSRLSSGLLYRAYLLVAIGRIYGLPVIITSSTRTQAEQDAFVNSGASLTRNSRHLFGNAFDIDMQGHSPQSVPQEVWNWMGELGEALGLKWGGRWRLLRDFRHFED